MFYNTYNKTVFLSREEIKVLEEAKSLLFEMERITGCNHVIISRPYHYLSILVEKFRYSKRRLLTRINRLIFSRYWRPRRVVSPNLFFPVRRSQHLLPIVTEPTVSNHFYNRASSQWKKQWCIETISGQSSKVFVGESQENWIFL